MQVAYNIPSVTPLPPKDLIFEVAYRQDSSMIKTEVGGTRLNKEVAINTSKSRSIPFTSRMVINADGQAVQTQWIPGANTIFVNDYLLEDGSKMPGLRSLGYDLKEELRKVSAKPLLFDATGYLYAETYSPDPMLGYFLQTHDYNQDAPFKSKAGGVISFLMFKQVKREVKNQKTLERIVAKGDIMKEIYSLYETTPSGIVYNTTKINAIAALLGISGQLAEPSDRYNAIVQIGEGNTGNYKTLVEGGLNELKLDLGKAVMHKVLSVGKDNVKMVTEGKPVVILTFKEGEDGLTELCYHILGNDGGKKLLSTINDMTYKVQLDMATK